MSRRGLLVILILAAVITGGLAYLATTFNLSALEEPTEFEVFLATRAKHWVVTRRAAREALPPEHANDALSRMNGFMQFGGSCASCHGQDGTTPTRIGLSMYPRVPGLGSPDVQQYANAELFWIIKHGIRLSGMPGFGTIHSDEQIWHLVHYVRSLSPPGG